MFTCKEYRKVKSLEEAWELNQKRSNLLVGGMLWVKMGQRSVQTVIDLSGLGLNEIEETEEEFRIGCMVTLRQLETHAGLNEYTCKAVQESVRHIVGVQFRNLATVGGSIFGRFGFSDVLTMLLAMDSYVELYKGGFLPLSEFVGRKRDRDILMRVIVKKKDGIFAYQSMRSAKTDFPTLAVAAACIGDTLRISVGARPARAMLLTVEADRTECPDMADAGMTEDTAVTDRTAEHRMTEDRAGTDCTAEHRTTEDRAGTDRTAEHRTTNTAAAAVRSILEGNLTEQEARAIGEYISAGVPTGSNLRGSAQYRSHLAGVLTARACRELCAQAGRRRM